MIHYYHISKNIGLQEIDRGLCRDDNLLYLPYSLHTPRMAFPSPPLCPPLISVLSVVFA